ncbi:MAG: exodeoxyribonuclease VII large subunit [Acidimicrobiia bacterium]|nr:exodeoxyribonuclease VII large subunit [Acidimicrobiia bacterium]
MSDERTWTVGELAGAVDDLLRVGFPDEVWVQGEISSLTRARSGHVYFELVGTPDPSAPGQRAPVLPVVLFSRMRRVVNESLRRTGAVRMTDGVAVRLRGRVALWGPAGRLQLQMSDIDPAHTLGAMAVARHELFARLVAEGLAEVNAALGLTPLPLRIGLVTSVGSAAHADVLAVLERSGVPFSVQVVDAPTQGPTAAPLVAAAIGRVARRNVDVVLLVRGGGARTDLVAFDDETVARAVAGAPVPVVVGIGHQVDRTVVDEVAHRTCPTPTAAAAFVVERVQASVQQVETAAERLVRVAERRCVDEGRRVVEMTDRLDRCLGATFADETAHLASIRRSLVRAGAGGVAAADARLSGATRLATSRASQLVGVAAADVERGTRRLDRGSRRGLGDADRSLTLAEVRLAASDPRRLLQRGWSITRASDGSVVRRVADAPMGTVVYTTVLDGTVRSTVDGPPGPADGVAAVPVDASDIVPDAGNPLPTTARQPPTDEETS